MLRLYLATDRVGEMARVDPVTDERTSLYERDFYLWLERQAELLREGRLTELDVANLLEEIESMGRKDKKAIQSNLVVVLAHLLKYQFQPKRRSNSWRGSIVEHRRRLRDDLVESPSLRGHAAAAFAQSYADAREQASAETGLPVETFPEQCPYTLEQALHPRFLPE
jgi:Domain of unknown function DUF29